MDRISGEGSCKFWVVVVVVRFRWTQSDVMSRTKSYVRVPECQGRNSQGIFHEPVNKNIKQRSVLHLIHRESRFFAHAGDPEGL
jgi:hypothetical protein